MRSVIATISIGLLLSTCLFTAAFAASGGPGQGPGMTDTARIEARIQKMEVLLDLTPEQAEQVRAVMTEAHNETAALRETSLNNKKKMRELRDAETFDETTARELARQQADNKVSMMAKSHATRQKIDAILTPEQRDKHEQMRELRKQQRDQKHGQHKGDRMGRN